MCGMWGSPQILPALASVGKTSRHLARSVQPNPSTGHRLDAGTIAPSIQALGGAGAVLRQFESLVPAEVAAPEVPIPKHLGLLEPHPRSTPHPPELLAPLRGTPIAPDRC